MQRSICPDRVQLAALKAGQLPAQFLDSVAHHVEICDACQSTLESLGRDSDPFVSALALSLASNSFANEAECGNAVTRFEAAGLELLRSPSRQPAPVEAGPLPLRIGQYEILELLGHGMGTVYKAFHSKLKRVVALKTLSGAWTADAQSVARFQREMEAIGKLDHANIVRATDAGEFNGTHFLVMEYVDGGDLAKITARHGRLSIPDACEVVRQAAIGLQHIHEHGLVHRDIKPSNLLMTSLGQVKIADLGLSLLRSSRPINDDLTETGQIVGTFDYLAPEQATDTHRVDIRADIYSLGCTLYRLLAGRAPFGASELKSPLKKAMAHVQSPVPPIRDTRPDVPETLRALLDRMLAKDPAERFATPAEVAATIEPFTAGCNLQRLCLAPEVATEAIGGQSHSLEPTRPIAAGLATPPRGVDRETPAAPLMIRRRAWRVAAAVALVALVGLAAIQLGPSVYRIVTNKGVIVIKTNDSDVQVSVKRNGEEVAILDTRTRRQITVTAGVYELQLKGGNETLKLKTDRFTLERNGRQIVEVYAEPFANDAPSKHGATDVASQLPPLQEELLLNEDFDGPEFTHDAADLRHFVRNGTIRIELSANREKYWFDQWRHGAASDVKTELRFRLYKRGIIWFFFRLTGDEHERSRLALNISPEGGYKLYRETLVPDPDPSGWKAKKVVVLKESSKPAWTQDENKWNTLRVTAWQNVLRLEANDQPACEVLERTWPPAIPTPLPGIRLHAEGKLTEDVVIELDSIRVWRLE